MSFSTLDVESSVKTLNLANVRAIVESISSAAPAVSKPLLKSLYASLSELPKTQASNDFIESAATSAVEILRPRVAAGVDADADYQLRFLLYLVHYATGDFYRAATMLSQARIDEGCQTDEARAEVCIKLSQTFLKASDDVNADKWLKFAKDWISKEGSNIGWSVSVQYNACWAQELDARKRFMEAAQRYLQLSLLHRDKVDEDELLFMLEKAAKCVVLAPAGPQRKRVMGTIVNDERISLINPRVSSMLDRMYNDCFVSPKDASDMEAMLEDHQRAIMSDGNTIFQRAVREHNINASQRVYSSVSFASLARRLNMDPENVEKLASIMISEKRLAASIDQVDGVLIFEKRFESEMGSGSNTSSSSSSYSVNTVGKSTKEGDVSKLLSYDAKVRDVCKGINFTFEEINKAYPALVKQTLLALPKN